MVWSHLVELLVETGADVTALSQYNSFNDWGWLEQLDCLRHINLVTGDICDPYFCHELIKGAEAIFHLAALIPISYSYRAPSSYVETNVNGTLNICQAALGHGARRLVTRPGDTYSAEETSKWNGR